MVGVFYDWLLATFLPVLSSACFQYLTVLGSPVLLGGQAGPQATGPENGREGLSMSPPRPTPPFTRRSTFQHELTKDKQLTQLGSLRFHTLLHWLCENRIQVQLRSRWKEMEIRS